MKVRHILEKLSSQLYHATSVDGALGILNSNQFKLSLVTKQREREISSSKMYYFSTSRSRLGWYNSNASLYGLRVMFTLNGEKLSHNYKGKAVDYWASTTDNNEMEDRILSDSPYIDNAVSYITAIDIYFNADELDDLDGDNKNKTRDLWKLADKHGIPVNVYDDRDIFVLGDKRRTINDKLKRLRNSKKKTKPPQQPRPGSNKLEYYVELYNTRDYDKLSDNAKEILDSIKYSSFIRDAVSSYEATLYVHRTNHDLLKPMLDIWRDENITRPKQYIEVIIDRWGLKK